MKKRQARFLTIITAVAAAAAVVAPNVLASGAEEGGEGHSIAIIFLWVAVILILAKV